MSFRFRSFTFLTLALVLTAFAAISFGQDAKTDATPKADKTMKRDGHRGHRMGRGGKFGAHHMGFRGIELTEDQKARIKAIREANKPDASVMAELKAIHEARRAGTLTDDQKTRAKAIRDAQMEKARSVREQIEAVLTAEQKAEIEKRRVEMKQRREQFREKREEFRKNRRKPATTDTKIG